MGSLAVVEQDERRGRRAVQRLLGRAVEQQLQDGEAGAGDHAGRAAADAVGEVAGQYAGEALDAVVLNAVEHGEAQVRGGLLA